MLRKNKIITLKRHRINRNPVSMKNLILLGGQHHRRRGQYHPAGAHLQCVPQITMKHQIKEL